MKRNQLSFDMFEKHEDLELLDEDELTIRLLYNFNHNQYIEFKQDKIRFLESFIKSQLNHYFKYYITDVVKYVKITYKIDKHLLKIDCIINSKYDSNMVYSTIAYNDIFTNKKDSLDINIYYCSIRQLIQLLFDYWLTYQDGYHLLKEIDNKLDISFNYGWNKFNVVVDHKILITNTDSDMHQSYYNYLKSQNPALENIKLNFETYFLDENQFITGMQSAINQIPFVTSTIFHVY